MLCLHIEVIGERERTRVVERGLLDYIVCLPWTVEAGSRAHRHACELVRFLRSKMTLPPSLINLARAKLSVMHFGLRRILEMPANKVFSEYHESVISHDIPNPEYPPSAKRPTLGPSIGTE